MNKRSVLIVTAITLAIFTIFAGAASAAVRYTITNLGPGSGDAINDSNEVTGFVNAADGNAHAFLYDGTTHDLGSEGEASFGGAINSSGLITGWGDGGSFLYDGAMHWTPGMYVGSGINDSGLIVGYTTGAEGPHAAVFDGAWNDIASLGETTAMCLGVNNSAEITGYYTTTGGQRHAFFYDGTAHDIGVLPGFTHSLGAAINADGDITGVSDNGSQSSGHVMLYDGTLHDLGTLPGYSYGQGVSINTGGKIVGYCANGTDERAFIYDGTMRDLNSLIDPASGWVLYEAHGINNSGCITGWGLYNGQGSAFLLTPILEPAAEISGPSVSATKSGPVTYAVTYTDAASVTLTAANVTLRKTGTAKGTVKVTGEGVATRTVTISSISGTGTLGISIAAGTASNGSGLAPAAGPSATFGVYGAAPKMVVSAPSVTATKSGPVTYTVTYTGAASVTLSAASVTLLKTGTANGTVSVSGDGTATRTVTVSNTTGDGTLAIRIAAGTASNVVGSAAALSSSAKFTVVNTVPTVKLGAPSKKSTKTGPVTYKVTYTGATAVSLSPADVTLNRTETANGVVTVTGTGLKSRKITISSITGDGSLGISIASGSASNVGGPSPAVGPSITFSVANTLPKATIGAPSTTTTRTGPVAYTVTYERADTISLTASKVTLIKTGTAKGTVSVSGTGALSRTVTISAVSGDGTLAISIKAGTAKNAAGKALATATSAAVTVTNSAPKAAISGPSAALASTGPVTYTVTYTGAESITLAAADIALNRTGTANGHVSVSESGAATRTVTVSEITGDGTLGISLAAGTCSNFAGPAAAAGPSATFTVVNTPPRVAISAASAGATRFGPVSFTVTYTGATAVTLTAAKVTLVKTGTANGTVAVTGTGTATRTVTISNCTGEGSLAISIAAGTASNVAGLAGGAGPGASFTVTNAVPTLSISDPSMFLAEVGIDEAVTYTITYTGATSITLTSAKVTLNRTGSANGVVSVSGTGTATRTVTITNISGDGTLGISIATGTATNAVGSAAAAGPASTFYVLDLMPPPPPD